MSGKMFRFFTWCKGRGFNSWTFWPRATFGHDIPHLNFLGPRYLLRDTFVYLVSLAQIPSISCNNCINKSFHPEPPQRVGWVSPGSLPARVSPSKSNKTVCSFCPGSAVNILFLQTNLKWFYPLGKQPSLRHPKSVAQHRPAGHQPEEDGEPDRPPAANNQPASQHPDSQLRLLRPGAPHQVRGEAAGQEPPRLESVLRGLHVHHSHPRLAA